MTRASRMLVFAVLVTSGVAWHMIGEVAYAQQEAQGATASLTGRVTDQSGAIVPGANLILQKKGGGTPMSSVSNGDGYYRFSLVSPGIYALTAKKAGFSTIEIPQIVLQVQQTANINLTLKPGTVVQEVNVSAAATSLQTQSSSLNGVVSSRTETALPLVLRDPTQLVNLVAGVTNDNRTEGENAGSNLGGLSYQGRLDFSMNGGIRDQAISMVDGVDVTVDAGSFSSVPVVPTPDFTQEFTVQTNNLSSQFGRGNGVLNIVTKSGTNEFHGDVFEFLQNNALDANNLFANTAGQPLPHLERNQYGVALGGPVYIPHVYNGKNKTFWFFNLEHLTQLGALPLITSVPTAAERAGNFSNDFATNGTPITIFDPYNVTVNPTTAAVVRQPFPNNQIPANLMNSPFAQKILSFYPLPNNPGVLAPGGLNTDIGNYNVVGSSPLDWDRYDVKLDQDVGSSQRLMFRYSGSLYHTIPINFFNNAATSQSLSTRNNLQPGQNIVFSWTWSASPTLVVTQAGDLSRFTDESTQPRFNVAQLGGPYASGSLEAYANSYAGFGAFPQIGLGGYAPLGNGFGNNYLEPFDNYSYQLGIIKTTGKHTLSAGFNFMWLQAGDNLMQGFGGQFNYGGFSSGPDPFNPSPFSGNSVADLLMGIPSGGSMSAGFSSLYKSKFAAWYLQDEVRVTPKLTLNLGFRYDFTTPFVESNNHEFRFNPNISNPLGDAIGPNTNGQSLDQFFSNLGSRPLQGAVQFPNSPGVSGRGMVPTDFGDPAPRLGFAYAATNTTVIRGGISRMYGLSPVAPGPSTPGNGPFGASTPIVGTINGYTPNVTSNDPFPAGFNVPTYDTQGMLSLLGNQVWAGAGPGLTPYSDQWNIGFEHQLPADSMISVVYAGEADHRLTCPFFACGDQIPSNLIQKYGPKVFNTVPNPFYGIITNPTLGLSAPTVQMGQLLKQWPAYSSVVPILPPWQGPSPNNDTFQSNFNALEVQYNKRFSHGLSIMAAYTWSKNITNADSFEGGYLGPQVGYQNQVTYQGEMSLAADNVPQRLVIGHVYDLPFGRGQRFGSNWSPALDRVLGHWEFSGMSTYQAGFPIPISAAGYTTGAFGGTSRPNLIGNPCFGGASRGAQIAGHTLNPAAFQLPANFTFGNAPRTLGCEADGIKDADWALIKNIPIKESFNIDFRAEFFNLFNRPQLGMPDTTFNSSGFGQIFNQANSPRIIQFGLKLNW